MQATGFKRARRRSKARANAIDPNVAAAISETVDDVHRAGSENIDAMTNKRSGALRRFYKKALRSRGARGLVGYLTKAGRRNAFYARFVHDGTAHSKARPFHDNAVLQFEGRHVGRMRAALARALSGKAAPSGLARTGGGIEGDVE